MVAFAFPDGVDDTRRLNSTRQAQAVEKVTETTIGVDIWKDRFDVHHLADGMN